MFIEIDDKEKVVVIFLVYSLLEKIIVVGDLYVE